MSTSSQLAIADASTPLASDFEADQTFAAVLSSTSASFYLGDTGRHGHPGRGGDGRAHRG